MTIAHDSTTPTAYPWGLSVRGTVLAASVPATAWPWSFHLATFTDAKLAALVLVAGGLALWLLWEGRIAADGAKATAPLWVLWGYAVVVHVVGGAAQDPTAAVCALAGYGLALLLIALAGEALRHKRWQDLALDAVVAASTGVACLAVLQYAGLVAAMLPEVPGYTQRAYGVFGNQDHTGGYIALGIPLVLVRWPRNRHRFHLVVLAVLVAGLALTGSRSAWLAAAAGATAAWGLAGAASTRTWRYPILVAAAVAATVTAAAPGATWHRVASAFSSGDTGIAIRRWIWDGTLRMIGDTPLVGRGPGNFAYWSPRYLGEALHGAGPGVYTPNTLHAVHAHSAWLEGAAEFGLMGVLCAAWFSVRMVRARGVAWAPITTLAVFALFNSIAHNPAFLLAGLVLTAHLLVPNVRAPIQQPRAAVGRSMAVCTLGVAVFICWAVLMPSALYRAGVGVPPAAQGNPSARAAAAKHPWAAGPMLVRYGEDLADAGRYAEAEAVLDQAYRRTDTGALHMVSGAVALHMGNAEEARHHLEACVYRWPTSEAAWRLLLLALSPEERPAARQAAQAWIPGFEAVGPR